MAVVVGPVLQVMNLLDVFDRADAWVGGAVLVLLVLVLAVLIAVAVLDVRERRARRPLGPGGSSRPDGRHEREDVVVDDADGGIAAMDWLVARRGVRTALAIVGPVGPVTPSRSAAPGQGAGVPVSGT